MDCTNSPITFEVPEGWTDLVNWIDAKITLDSDKAIAVFDAFLRSISSIRINHRVLNALKREVPVTIPCEAFDDYDIISARVPGAILRMSEPASLVFENDRIGEVDYRRYGGEEQPKEENLLLLLRNGDGINYQFFSKRREIVIVTAAQGEGELRLSIGLEEARIYVTAKNEYRVVMTVPKEEKNNLWVSCIEGSVKLDYINLSYPEICDSSTTFGEPRDEGFDFIE